MWIPSGNGARLMFFLLILVPLLLPAQGKLKIDVHLLGTGTP